MEESGEFYHKKKNKILRLHPNPLLQVINNDQSLKSLQL